MFKINMESHLNSKNLIYDRNKMLVKSLDDTVVNDDMDNIYKCTYYVDTYVHICTYIGYLFMMMFYSLVNNIYGKYLKSNAE